MRPGEAGRAICVRRSDSSRLGFFTAVPPPRILNPHDVPVAGTDAHLPAVPAPAMTAASLRQRFGQPGPWQPEFPGDDADPAATALREAEEEVGLPRHRVEVIGQMPDYTTVTHFVVTPVVALVQPPFDLALDRFEVAEAFEVPLPFLMNPAHPRRHVFSFEGGQRQFLSMPWQGLGADGLPREYFIWGATAAMLRNLYRFLAR